MLIFPLEMFSCQVSDSMNVKNVIADLNNSSDGQVIDIVMDKDFDGVALCSTLMQHFRHPINNNFLHFSIYFR
jgi:5S rRNA maturation endonuclease (ribonuclease M5)